MRVHTARAKKQLLQSFKQKVLDNPAQTPNLAASNFHLFLHLKKHLAGQKFHEDRGEKQSHYAVACAGRRVLWHQNIKNSYPA